VFRKRSDVFSASEERPRDAGDRSGTIQALFKFTKAVLAGEPVQVVNYRKHRRDFTCIDDIVEGVIRILDRSAPGNRDWDSDQPDPGTRNAP